MRLFRDESPVGPEVDLYSDTRHPTQGEYVGTMELEEGPNKLLFKIVGKNDKSRELGFDLTNIVCERDDLRGQVQ